MLYKIIIGLGTQWLNNFKWRLLMKVCYIKRWNFLKTLDVKTFGENIWDHWRLILQTIRCWVYKIFSIQMQNRLRCLSFYSCWCQKINTKIGLEYGLFSRTVKIWQTIIRKAHKASKKKKKKKRKISIFKFKVRLVGSKQWFSLEYNWIKTNFNTIENYFYHRLFQRYITGEDNLNENIFHVPIGSAKNLIWIISILMHLQSNIFNMTRILVV